MKLLEAPAVTLRADRAPDHPVVITDAVGIRFEGGRRSDQADLDLGVLWEQWSGPATGTPFYGVLDPEVQREAADRLLCAYCHRPAGRTPEGMLWLLQTDTTTHTWPASIRTITPPICLPHAELALERCATLRRGHLAVRAPEAERIGVLGSVYSPDGLPGEPDELVLFTDTARLPFVLARYLLLELRGAAADTALRPLRKDRHDHR
ncbi:hypothetical protein [Streptomyces lavendulae]|uniref:hypothetical protein n=1 Tax=Streptomyces lavendulae TaxID=1914 RepID=UPI0033CEA5DC